MLSIVLLYMYVLSTISHTFKPNQAPNGFTSLALEKTINLQLTSELNSTSLRKQNHDWIYQATMEDDAEVFLVPKIVRLNMQPFLSNGTFIRKFGQ